MYGMTPVGVFFIAILPPVINDQALCQQPHFVQKFRAAGGTDRRPFFLLGKEVRLSLQPTSGPTR